MHEEDGNKIRENGTKNAYCYINDIGSTYIRMRIFERHPTTEADMRYRHNN